MHLHRTPRAASDDAFSNGVQSRASGRRVATGRQSEQPSAKPRTFLDRLRFSASRNWLSLCALLVALASPVVGTVVGYQIGHHNSRNDYDSLSAGVTIVLDTLIGFIAGLVVGAVLAALVAVSGDSE